MMPKPGIIIRTLSTLSEKRYFSNVSQTQTYVDKSWYNCFPITIVLRSEMFLKCYTLLLAV